MTQMFRVESKPQGALFTGRVEPTASAVYAEYRTESAEYLHVVAAGGEESWWRVESASPVAA